MLYLIHSDVYAENVICHWDCITICFAPYPAPPLTLDNVFVAVKTVRSWRELAKGLMGWIDYGWDKEGQKKLAAIQRQHVSDEARLKAVLQSFHLGEGDYQPSGRRVIHALHCAGESHLAEKIKTNAELHQGEWVCINTTTIHTQY